MNNTTLLFEGTVFFAARPTTNHPGYEDILVKLKTKDSILDVKLYATAGGPLSMYNKGDTILVSSVVKEDGSSEFRHCAYAIEKNSKDNQSLVARQLSEIYERLLELKVPEEAAMRFTPTVYIQANKLV